MRYFCREYPKSKNAPLSQWGRSLWWFEVDNQNHTVRQITMFEAGVFLKYTSSHSADSHGRLIDLDITANNTQLKQITEEQFHNTWVMSGASNHPWPSTGDPPAMLATHGWELESALERHRKNPETFQIPAPDEIKALKVGDQAKLLVEFSAENEKGPYIQVERLWVGIAEIKNGRFIGALQSRPASSDVLLPGDVIVFGPEHIASV